MKTSGESVDHLLWITLMKMILMIVRLIRIITAEKGD
jgi:hypothetical protein